MYSAEYIDMFLISNGTGARCHVAGWGKDEFSGNFQFIQHKVDIPLMDDFKCNAALKLALNRRQRGVGDRSVVSKNFSS